MQSTWEKEMNEGLLPLYNPEKEEFHTRYLWSGLCTE